MSGFFLLLFLVSLVGLVIGIIKPSAIKLKSRKSASLTFGGAIVISFILFGITSPASREQPTVSPSSAIIPPAAEQSTTTKQPSKPTPTPVTQSAPQLVQPLSSPQKTWHAITTFGGNGSKTTTPFTTQGKQWRINWQTTGQYDFYVHSDRTDKQFSLCYSMVKNFTGSGSDTSYCYEGGEFYLTVNTGNQWTIAVEDYY